MHNLVIRMKCPTVRWVGSPTPRAVVSIPRVASAPGPLAFWLSRWPALVASTQSPNLSGPGSELRSHQCQ